MTAKQFSSALGNIGEKYIEEAIAYNTKKKTNPWLKWGAIAACLLLVVGVTFRIAVAFIPSQMTDVFREGNMIEITDENDLPAKYDGKILAFNLDFENYEFYYEYDGTAAQTDDWYSLLALKHDQEGRIILHCMFGETTVEDWKVSRVFTEKATRKINVNGVEVDIARHELSLQYEYWYYAIFEYDDVVYDIRIQSNNADYVYEVLDTLIKVEG